MDRNTNGLRDGGGIHRRVAERLGGRPRQADWREARDLSLVLAVSTSAPLAFLTIELGANPALALGLTALTAAAACGMVRILRKEYALDLWAAGPIGLAFGPSRTTSRWQTIALRLVPARHQTSAAEVRSTPGVAGPARRAPGRTRRQRPGS